MTNGKLYIFGFIAFWSLISCSKSIMETQASNDGQTSNPSLKSAFINYYVATTGNDNNSGTLASPFKTIQKAANVVSPGDTVIVRDGVYSTNSTTFISLNTSGTNDNYITFKSENKWGAVLDGLDNGTTGGQYCFMLGGKVSYIKIIDFEIKGFVIDAIQLAGGTSTPNTYISIEGNNIHHIGAVQRSTQYGGISSYLADANHITYDRNIFHDSGWEAQGFGNATQQGIYLDGCSYITITRNIFYNNKGGWSIQIYSGSSKTTSHVDIYNNTFAYGTTFTPGHIIIAATATQINIKNNIFYSAYQKAIRLFAATLTDLVVTNNIIGTTGILYGEDYVTWNNAIVQSNNQSNTNPLMINPANYDFRLQAGSPCIIKGVNVGLTSDYLKSTIIGLPDIGAYAYQGQVTVTPPSSTIYYNTQTSATATKSDCGSGYTGSTVTYTVAANKYSSTVSQVDADSQATADLTANKQTYANANGTCTAIPLIVYYNIQQSGTATKNDCGTGYTGSTVTYIVPAKKYSSTVSQADADNKAIADVASGKQTYANANGTCTAIPLTVYYNIQQSGTATKNDCGTGYTGSTVTYIVTGNKYSSTVSQADADNKAIADVSSGKQAYANANGTCTAIPLTVYYNIRQSGTATKNSCGTGYTGSTVTYTVSANKYSTTTSQTDANNLAIADVNNNKQAYANANGTCTVIITATTTKKPRWRH